MLLTWPQFHLLFSTLFEAESKIADLGIEHTFILNRLMGHFPQNELKKLVKASTW